MFQMNLTPAWVGILAGFSGMAAGPQLQRCNQGRFLSRPVLEMQMKCSL
jgi:hypothetical protein